MPSKANTLIVSAVKNREKFFLPVPTGVVKFKASQDAVLLR